MKIVGSGCAGTLDDGVLNPCVRVWRYIHDIDSKLKKYKSNEGKYCNCVADRKIVYRR